MDGQRFDEVTKALAAGTSRRTVLRTALGGMGAGLLALVGIRNASATDTLSCIDECNQLEPGLARAQCIQSCATDTLSCLDDCQERFEPGLARAQCVCACTTGGDTVCEGNFVVDEETCECVCPADRIDCLPGQTLNLETCECEGGNGGGTPCGPTTCPEGQVCCNESCGICTEPEGSCIEMFCGPV
jgi:hypothetical protein